jgi:hypothetical protein
MTRWLALTSFALLGVALVLVLGVAQQSAAQNAAGEGRPDYYAEGWTRLNPLKNFIESAHPIAKDVYINEIGASHALLEDFPFPEDTVLVKESLDPDTLEVFVLTAMRKVGGFDPDNNDWQYGMFERNDEGEFEGMWADVGSDMHQMCSGCHARASDSDFVFLTYREGAWNSESPN